MVFVLINALRMVRQLAVLYGGRPGTLGVLLLIAPSGVPGRWLGFAWLLPVFLVRPPSPPEGAFRLTALDVGQGLSIVVETAHHALVYDTGPRVGDATDAGGRIVAPYLRAAGISALDAMVVSHQDLDHSGGALSLLQTVPTSMLWSSLPVGGAIVSRASERGTAWRCAAGQSWQWDGVAFTIVFPPMTQYAENGVKTKLSLEKLDVKAETTGDVAEMTVEHVFRNDSEDQLEGRASVPDGRGRRPERHFHQRFQARDGQTCSAQKWRCPL